MLSLDTETTGLDTHHGAKPYFVTTCDENKQVQFWSWPVDPLTREPLVPPEDVDEILQLVGDPNQSFVLQNAKFDVAALRALDPRFGDAWPWSRTDDTLIAGHLLASNQAHDLTSMTMHYLGVDLLPFDKALEDAVKKCRRIVQVARRRVKDEARRAEKARLAALAALADPDPAVATKKKAARKKAAPKKRPPPNVEYAAELAKWAIAEKGRADMPSAGEGTWKIDGWLPSMMARWFWQKSEAGEYWARTEGKLGLTYRVNKAAALCGWAYRPPEVAAAAGDPKGAHPWYTVLARYGNADSVATAALWRKMKSQIASRGLDAIYQQRRKVPAITHRMEHKGVTINSTYHAEVTKDFKAESDRLEDKCVDIAKGFGYDLVMPKSGSNQSLRTFAFDHLKLPAVKRSKETGAPSLDKEALETYLSKLDEGSPGYDFCHALVNKRSRDTALTYLAGYQRFWRKWVPLNPDDIDPVTGAGWYVLHPSLNPTGTDTLRWSSSNPNEQNISKKGVPVPCKPCAGTGETPDGQPCKACKGRGDVPVNVRQCFGPAPGREWWSCDAQNIELRIPAYEAKESEFIALFERPDDPPYFGSNHLLISHILHPERFEACKDENGRVDGRIFKKLYAATWYQWVKNGNFAVQYGAVDREDGLGTADRAYHLPGAQAKIKTRFAKMEALNQHYIRFAERHGYVETIPDRSVDPSRGYPVLCTRTERGTIKPTVPLNYHVQSTAMWWTMRAMIKCEAKLEEWRRRGFDAYITMQVHDEIVFDLPRSSAHPSLDLRPDGKPKLIRRSNLWRVRELQAIMASCGDDIGIPTPVGCEYHDKSWGEGVTI